MTTAYLNRIATVVPQHDVHEPFIRYVRAKLAGDRNLPVFARLVARCEIAHRWSCLEPEAEPAAGSIDTSDFYRSGRFPSTAARMRRFAIEAPGLAQSAVERLELGREIGDITHLVFVTCTGFSAPGADLELIGRCGLDSSVERTMVGFMGCHGTFNGLKLARHIVRSEPAARVLLVSLELCTLHFQEVDDIDRILSFLLFGDGCGAALVTADPTGLSLDQFHAELAPEARGQITWSIGDSGFDMFLSKQVPESIRHHLRSGIERLLAGAPVESVDLWAVHPGGRAILDAAESALELGQGTLHASRDVMRRFGNMSSATILFVLQAMLATAKAGELGCAMAFGPGLSMETMLFHAIG